MAILADHVVAFNPRLMLSGLDRRAVQLTTSLCAALGSPHSLRLIGVLLH